MGNIIKLSQHITNLIAAGEVIEHAASVVKELVENSIDAGANMIEISLQDSGLKEIIVRDNGCGMSQNDAKLCFQPHATSKIKMEEDLFRINTLGFRGEALPSIVAVSNFTIKTSNDGNRGYLYTLKAGLLVTEAVIAFPKGTEVCVRNLFYNVPARLQNLKPANIELAYSVDIVQKYALANPKIAFKLFNNSRLVLQTYGSNRDLEVISLVYGGDIASSMRDIFNNDGLFQIKGYISKLNISKANRSHINICINGRVVKNSNISRAVVESYEQYLTTGRYPICLIRITTDPGLVDVNIHPAKLEVKFSNETQLIELIKNTIADALKNTNLIIDLDKKNNKEVVEDEDNETTYSDEYPFEYAEESTDAFPKVNEKVKVLSEDSNLYKNFKTDQTQPIIYEESNKLTTQAKESILRESYQQYSFHDVDEVLRLPKLYYIGQLFGTYLLTQSEEKLYLIDQHAANERINYEKIIKELQKDEVAIYDLLIPLKLNFTSAETLLILEKLNEIKALGIVLEDFGGGTFTVRQVPVWLIRGREQEFIEEIVFSIINNRKTQKHQFLDSLAKSLACKKSVKANNFLSKMEIEFLLEDLVKCYNPYTCPHGRPVIVSYSKNEIEKWFKRIV